MDQNSSNNRNKGGSGIGSWIAIAVLFSLGLWELALPWLFFKLFLPDVGKNQRREAPSLSREGTQKEKAEQERKKQQKETAAKARRMLKGLFQSPKDGSRTAILLIAVGALVAIGGLSLFGAPLLALIRGSVAASDVSTLLQALAVSIGGGAMVASGIGMKRSIKRYGTYLAVIGPNEAMDVSVIAKKSGVSKKQAMKDLQAMLDKGYFGESAYLNRELGYIFMSSRADEELSAARAAAAEKTRTAVKSEAAKQNANAYDQILAQIRDVNDRIPDPEMTEKISEIEEITRQIFRAVEQDPGKRGKIDRFMSYFLPTTLKLLESYSKLEATDAAGENVAQSRRSIEIAMGTVVDGFRHQLDELYESDAMNIETEVDVLTRMMNQEMGTAKDFRVPRKAESTAGGAAAQTASGSVSLGSSAAQSK